MFSHKQRTPSASLTEQEAYWEKTLAGNLPLLTTFADHQRPPFPSFIRFQESLQLGAELSTTVKAYSEQGSISSFALLFAALTALLARYSNQEDVIVGSLSSDSMLSWQNERFINPLALRTSVHGAMSGRQLIGQVIQTIEEAAAHRDYPFLDLVHSLNAEQAANFAPIFQVMFVLCGEPGDLTETPLSRDDLADIEEFTTRCDLFIAVSEQHGSLIVNCEYDGELWKQETIRKFLERYRLLLEGIIDHPDQSLDRLPLVTAAERRQLQREWNMPRGEFAKEACVHQLFEIQVQQRPDAIAVVCEDDRLTYYELNRRANQLARYLRALGVGPEVLVGLCMERSLEMIIGLLGILKAGGVCLPLDPAYPSERLAYMVEDAEIAVLITQQRLLSRMPAQAARVVCIDTDNEAMSRENEENLPLNTEPENLVYVIYTSGSTGKPKGAGIIHGAAAGHFMAIQWLYDLVPEDIVLQIASLSFDSSFEQIFSTLLGGATLVLTGPEVWSTSEFFKHAAFTGLTVAHLPTAYWHQVVQDYAASTGEWPISATGFRLIAVGGEKLSQELVRLWNKFCAGRIRLLNGYGPTEATITSSFFEVLSHFEAALPLGGIPIGCPFAGRQLYVLNEQAELVPPGMAGELCIGGHALARGYLKRPEFTAERFIPDPFGGEAGGRLYRTGDLVRYLPDGNLEFLGRIDHQIKIRGFRVEPGEVEALLARHPAVYQCVVLAIDLAPGDTRLAAYLVANPEALPAISELRKHLQKQLPDYMIPSFFVLLDTLPLTPNGKVDRRRLLFPDPATALRSESFVPARNQVEEMLIAIWSEVLGAERIGIHDDFFEAGGHSLLATQVVSRLRTAIGVELPQRSLFETPTVATLAERVEAALRSEPRHSPPPLQARECTDRIPLSFAQQRLWFIDQLEPGSPLYTIPAALRLTGFLHFVALERSLNEVIRRHEALRTIFLLADQEPVQVIQPPSPLKLCLLDLSGLGEDEKEAEIRRLAREETRRPFDLTRGPLVRMSLLRLGKRDHILLLTMHHSVSDGWSMSVFHHEVAILYQAFSTGSAAHLPELPVQYRDFALWQRQWLGEAVLEPQLAYWKQQLGADLPVVELPTDFFRPAVQTYRGARQYKHLPVALTQRLRNLSQREGVTLFMVLLAAFQTLLYRYTGQEDIVVGTDIAGRNFKEIEGLIGFFVNQLVLRTDLSGNPSFRELLARVREVALGAYTHQDLPFEKLVEALKPVREVNRAPLFQIKIVWQNAPSAPDHMNGLSISPLDLENETARFDLLLAISDTPQGLESILEYSTDLFAAETIARMWEHLQNILEAVLHDPTQRISNLPLLGMAEQRQLAALGAGPRQNLASRSLAQLFEEQAACVPDALAVISSTGQMSYAAVNQRSNQLACYLRSLGVKPETLVALCMERSLEMVIGLLAILKAGGAYVPLDPTYPRERLAFMIEDAQVSVLLTQERHVSELPASGVQVVLFEQAWEGKAAEDTGNLSGTAMPDNLAYVIYTSGSTGRPKGVLATHREAANLVEALIRAYGVQPGRRFLQFVSLNFDVSMLDIFMVLGSGSTLCLPPADSMSSGQVLYDFLQEQATTFARIPPVMLAGLPGEDLPHLRTLITGGERWPSILLVRWSKGRSLFNEYGTTEGGLCTTISQCRKEARHITIGRPVANTEIYLLDAHLQLVPPGVRGEVYIGGAGLARGYHGRADLTAERFLPHPFSDEPGARLYRTGDEARFLPDGELELCGRIDDQVKIRGYRIELEEIEGVLSQHSAVQACTVSIREDIPGEKRLVAYIVPAQGVTPVESDIREHLKGLLPDYMLPSLFVTIEELPLTPSGKVDRRALPDPAQTSTLPGEGVIAPRNHLEQVVSECWEEILGLDEVSVYDNFFDVGGHSLLATRLLSLIWNRFQVEVPVRTFFEEPTIAGLASQVEELLQSIQARQEPVITPIAREGDLPLSFAQQRLWFINQLEAESAAYNIPSGISLKGPLIVQALSRSLQEIVRRHETLRTIFTTVAGQPVQRVLPPSSLPIQLLTIDLARLSRSSQEAEIQRLMTQESKQIFDLARGPLLRARLIRLQEREHILLLTTHHIASDGWSMDIFISELRILYNAFSRGLPSPLPELPIQYGDYAAWQRKWLGNQEWQVHLNYWQHYLANATQILELPADHLRPVLQTFDGAHLPFTLSLALTEQLHTLSKREGTTLFMTLLAAYQTLLYRYSGQEDLIVGTPVANRTRAEIEHLIGFFVNMLMIRASFTENMHFIDVLKQTRQAVLDAYAHQNLPFEKLVEVLQPQRSLSYSPLFQVVFIFQEAPAAQQLKLDGLEGENLFFESGTAKYDLTLQMWEDRDRLAGVIEYKTHLFEAATIQRMLGHWQTLLEGLVARPGQNILEVPLLTGAEQERLLVTWNATQADYPAQQCMHHVFELQADQRPDAVALVHGDAHLTYSELDRRANQLAHYLCAQGVGPEVLVGLCLDKSLEMIIGLLGVLKAGGAYVPLDPTYPRERLAFMLEDASVAVVLTSASLLPVLRGSQTHLVCLDRDWPTIADFSPSRPSSGITADNLAYVIYTSGSTGKPKGAMIRHLGVCNLTRAQMLRLHLSPEDHVLQFSSLNFDVSLWETIMTVSAGATLYLATPEALRSGPGLTEQLQREQISTITLTPSVLATLSPRALPALQKVITAGEACTAELVSTWTADRHFFDAYGPTEITACAVLATYTADDKKPCIGRPLTNTQVYVLDHNMQPVPVGIPGELYIGGDGVGRGYLNRPELTAERFVPDPFGGKLGARLYKTDDLVRYLPTGSLEFLGRLDHQIKLRGFRIEPGEIEAALGQHTAVRECVVLVREDRPSDKKLVAYVVARENEVLTTSELRRYLQTKLPDYMVPAAFVFVESIPLNPSGKVDRQALPEPQAVRPNLETTYAAPQTVLERAIATIWQEALRIETVGIHDNFFDLGGHSLLIVQVHSKLKETLGRDIAVVDLFKYPTISALAAYLGHGQIQPGFEEPRRGQARRASLKERREAKQLDRQARGSPGMS